MSELAPVRTLSNRLSPAQAAKRVGVSRWTITRAIKSGDLSAERNNQNHWLLEPSKVDAWAAAQGAQGAHPVHAPPPAQADAQVQIASLERQVESLKSQLTFIEDHWQQRLSDNDAKWAAQVAQQREDRARLERELVELATPWWAKMLRRARG